MMNKIKKAFSLLRQQGPGTFAGTVRRYCREKKEEKAQLALARSFHLISGQERAAQRQAVFQDPLTFSILTPLFNTPRTYLTELLDSLAAQTYGDWQLCLYDASDDAHAYVGQICRERAAADPRISYEKAEKNLGISGNTNACLRMAKGTYIGLLDHDDILHESALYEMRSAIEARQADFLYSDEVKFSDAVENARDFNFKPDFGKDELRSHNFICHFTVFQRSLLNDMEDAYRPAFDGSQDHDMVLRLTERAARIVHIPKVLYYWRVHPESVSMNLDSKSYAVDAAIRAIQEQLDRTGERGTVASNLPYRTIYRVRYQVPPGAKVTVFLHGCRDQAHYEQARQRLAACTAWPDVEILPLYGTDGGETLGALLNRQISQASGAYIALLHADCEMTTAEWAEEMLMFAIRPDVCAVSPKICYEDGTICYAGLAMDGESPSGLRFPGRGTPDTDQGFEAMLRHVRNTTAAWNICCMFSRKTYESLEGFAEDMDGYEAADLSLRGVQAGKWNVWTCFAGGILRDRSLDQSGALMPAAFAGRWRPVLDAPDPFVNPALKKLNIL